MGLDRGDWDEDGALRAALGRTAERLDLVHMPLHHGRTRPHALPAAAYAQPVLRRLMPVNSHFDLWFSTSVKEAWTAGIGYSIRPYDEDGLYAVRNRGKLLARTGTAEEAVAVPVAALSEGIGPAR
ncbi:DUF6193 family natural product biosynthesis protein [Streptomyces cinereoruber]